MFFEWPDDSIQKASTGWWIRKAATEAARPERWDLLVALVPYFGETPYRLQEISRATDREHTKVDYQVAEYDITATYPKPELPVAAFPEPQYQFSGKVRPVLVVGHVHKCLSGKERGSAKWQTKPTLAVAPYYGAEANGDRGGWPTPFVDRIRRAYYPQYFCDHLPPGLPLAKGGNCTSILRLDHVFPLNRPSREEDPPRVFQHTGWTLHPDARGVMEDWLGWLLRGGYLPNKPVHVFKQILSEDGLAPAPPPEVDMSAGSPSAK